MYHKQLDDYFQQHQEELVDAVTRLCRIPSFREEPQPGKPYGEGPAAALAEALRLSEELGFSAINYENYVGAIDLNDKPAQLNILAHLDVVPAGDEWTVTEPFTPKIVGTRLYGRGTADDKGPAVCALMAMKAVKDLNIPLSYNCRLILGCDEECGSSDIKYYFSKEPEAPMTFSPDADFPVINTEKATLHSPFAAEFLESQTLPRVLSIDCGVKVNVVPGSAHAVAEGISFEETSEYAEIVSRQTGVTFNITEEFGKIHISAKGISGHASLPHTANNALTALLKLLSDMPFASCAGFDRIQAVSRLFPHGDWAGRAAGVDMEDFSGSLTISLNMFHYTPSALDGVYDCRAPLCATNENLRDVLKAGFSGAGIEMENHSVNPGHHVAEDSVFIKTLLKCYEQYSGKKGSCVAIGGGTYVHHLKNGVAFGCADPEVDNHMHGADEFAEIPQLIMSAKIFAQAIIDLCGRKDS